MVDIFISYSRKDAKQALELAGKLRSENMTVWIDQHGIGAADHWATEIAEALHDCKTLVLLLSPHSVHSHNVLKEVSLASERQKRILPVELTPTTLSPSFEYALAGLQRVDFENFPAVLKALRRKDTPIIPKPARDHRKSVMVLPFEDLSQLHDNVWFADGLTSELISALSSVKSLRLIDWKTTMEFKDHHAKTADIARELGVRYFVEGNIRKVGDEIKITTDLLDIQDNIHLWQHTYKGHMTEIFHIQEEVAKSIVDGLHIKLSKSEEKRVLQRGTDNVEAYEAFLRGAEYYDSHTREGFLKAVDMLMKAIECDPDFASAYRLKSLAHAELYRRYERKKSHLAEAERLVKRAIELRPDQWRSYQSLCTVYELEGKLQEAEATALEYVRKAPRDSHSHNALGYFYMITHQYDRAIEPYEKSLHLQPDSLQVLWNMVMVCDLAKHKQKAHNWAEKALPHFEKHLEYHPHDQMARVHYPALLHLSGRDEDALKYMRSFNDIHDGTLLYNVAYLQARLNDHEEAVVTLRRAIDSGFSHIEILHRWLAEHPGRPEYEELVKHVEEKNAVHHPQ